MRESLVKRSKGEINMSAHASRVHTYRLKGFLLAWVLGVVLTGCYTRQIEGIQKDLDLMDRKLHKANISQAEQSSAISPDEIVQLKKELESVQSRQMGLTSDLENLKAGVDSNPFETALSSEPFPVPMDSDGSQEIERLRKQIADNQKEIDRFDRELKELKTTFDEVKASMLDVIQLIKEEYVEEAPVSDPVSGPPALGEESVSLGMPGPPPHSSSSSGGDLYEVKAGDSLNLIASRHGVSVDDLKEVNQITNPDRLIMGQKILIP